MTIRTPFTELFGLACPVALGPMASVAGGRLAAAVSAAGGLGLVGGGYGDRSWLEEQLGIVAAEARGPWGVGLIAWSLRAEILELALASRPAAVMLAFGDPAPYAAAVKAAGARLICQVHDVGPARQAVAAGADVIVAQGTEAGGHGGSRSTLPLVPAVADAVAPVPVLAAGGIADGRGLAAALMLGAAGALLGTRFYASPEALGHPRVKRRLAEAAGGDTCRTRVFDAARGLDWPAAYTGRAVRNAFTRRWDGREDDLRADRAERDRLRAAIRDGDPGTAPVWAGEGLDLISSLEPAADIVGRIGADAERTLRAAARLTE